jgi:anthranilate synthase component 1
MFHPTREEFKKLCRRGDLVPVAATLMADLETPVSAFLKLGGHPNTFLLESAAGEAGQGRWSFLGWKPRSVLTIKGGRFRLLRDGVATEGDAPDPLAAVQAELGRHTYAADGPLPPFCGGAVGYLSYDAVRSFERLPATLPDDLGLPEACFLFTDITLAFDRYTNTITIVSLAQVDGSPEKAYSRATAAISEVIEALRRPLPAPPPVPIGRPAGAGFRSSTTPARYRRMVERAREHILAGDILQAVLSIRFETPLFADPFDVYRALRVQNPSPYMFYLRLDDHHLLGASPELMARKMGDAATLRPIAGTRPRGRTPDEDRNLEKELLADAKERAEHVMLVDLARNDLGRVCLPGTVAVPDYLTVERYSHVMHLVSTVTGRLRPGVDAFDLVRASFPAGTVSGAPKIRAMEIIEELESRRRGPYAGLVGYFDHSGNFDSAITIRSVVVKEGTAYLQAGAGIVADSVPEREYQECRHKARVLFRALEMARGGK